MPQRPPAGLGDFPKKYSPWALLSVLGLALAVRVWVLAVTQNGIDFHFNAYDQPLFTWYDWMRSERIIPLASNSPMYYVLLRIFFSIFGFDPFVLPRLISLAFGVASLVPLMSIARRLFGERAALWTGAAAAFYPLAVRLSSVSLEVTVFHFFALMAIRKLVSIDPRKPSLKTALASGLWLTLACATRFEGWLLIPLMTALFLRNSFKQAFVFGAAASLFPLAWMAASRSITGDPFGFAAISAVVQHLHLGGFSLTRRLLGWPAIILRTGTVPILSITAAGLAVAARRKKGLVPAACGLGLIALFMIFTARGTMALNETKYIAGPVLFLLPFFGAGVEALASLFTGRRRTAAVALLLAASAVAAAARIQDDNRLFAVPRDVDDLCRYLSHAPEDKGKILLGVGFQGYILTHGGQPYDRFVLVPGDDATGRRSEADFRRIVKAEAPCLLIHNLMPDRLDFQDLVPVSKKTPRASLNGYDFQADFISESGTWMVLSIRTASPDSANSIMP